MDLETSWKVIEQQRRAIADLLDGLPEEDWDTPSLCAGWRIREVAAHLALTPQPPSPRVMLATGIRARGNYNRFIDILTTGYANQPTGELVSQLRDHAASRKLPSLTNYRNILFDTMVHGQDIAIPLGRSLEIPPDAAAAGADRAVEVGWPVWDRHRLDGIRLRATDIDWVHGTGREVSGPVTALLLLITGRTARVGELTGEGLTLATSRLRMPTT
ncbi:maleylpyruvate isomerase family mycothiol-dependent enzyme [Nocardia sp. NPDC004722]